MKSETKEIDYIVLNDGICAKCGKPIPEPQEGEGDAVMCDCTVWFINRKKAGIICKDCPNLIISGRQIKCKVCNIKKKLEKDSSQCILKLLVVNSNEKKSDRK